MRTAERRRVLYLCLEIVLYLCLEIDLLTLHIVLEDLGKGRTVLFAGCVKAF